MPLRLWKNKEREKTIKGGTRFSCLTPAAWVFESSWDSRISSSRKLMAAAMGEVWTRYPWRPILILRTHLLSQVLEAHVDSPAIPGPGSSRKAHAFCRLFLIHCCCSLLEEIKKRYSLIPSLKNIHKGFPLIHARISSLSLGPRISLFPASWGHGFSLLNIPRP